MAYSRWFDSPWYTYPTLNWTLVVDYRNGFDSYHELTIDEARAVADGAEHSIHVQTGCSLEEAAELCEYAQAFVTDYNKGCVCRTSECSCHSLFQDRKGLNKS